MPTYPQGQLHLYGCYFFLTVFLTQMLAFSGRSLTKKSQLKFNPLQLYTMYFDLHHFLY